MHERTVTVEVDGEEEKIVLWVDGRTTRKMR